VTVFLPAIPALFLVGEVEGAAGPRRYYVYPYTAPPDDPESLGPGTLQTEEAAHEHAAWLNQAVSVFVAYIVTGTAGALIDEIIQWGMLPGSPASKEAEAHLVRLGRALINSRDAQAACAFFQMRILRAREAGREDARLNEWIRTIRPRGKSGLSAN
jgi:hypothetical protein